MELPFRKIAILGMGLMGGSFCKAILEVHLGEEPLSIRVYDPSSHRFKAPAVTILNSPEEAVEGAELILLGCPLGAMADVLSRVSENLIPGALVMDLGSVKGSVADWMTAHLPDTVSWIGGHPMCGSEKSGVGFAKSDLFKGASFFLTEGKINNKSLKPKIEGLLQLIGANPQWCSNKIHDESVAMTSHLPHLSAAILMNSMPSEAVKSLEPFMAGGFKDTTRIAAANPSLWKDILHYNKDEVLRALDAYEFQLQTVKAMLAASDEIGLEAFLERASTMRRSL